MTILYKKCRHGVSLSPGDVKKATYCLGCWPYGTYKKERSTK